MSSGRRARRLAALAAALVALGAVRGADASPNHDELQRRETVQTSSQRYGGRGAARGRRLGEAEETCESVFRRPFEQMRIGHQFLDADDVSDEVKEHIEKVVLARAIGYWSQTLKVRRAREPLRAEYTGRDCQKYGLAFDGRVIAAEEHYTCEAASPPACGPHGLTIPEKYLRSKRVCSKKCTNVVETFAHLLGAPGLCDNCTDLPEGPGVPGHDFLLFVTLKDDYCEGDVQAHATTCVKDQCDRPIFGLINFCRAKISLDPAATDRQVTTAVHEIAHTLAFSAHHFQFFRNADGTPMMPRDASDPSLLRDAVPWSCRHTKAGTEYAFPDPQGGRRYADLSSAGIIGKFGERGVDSCPCPVGRPDMLEGCILPPQPDFRAPQCVFKMTTPTVRRKAQEFFGCDSLPGAELENQPTSPCVIVSSHWEQRSFMGEVMVSAQVIQPTFVSEVTLALFQDSGWYEPDYRMADKLVKGVHWGYLQGCAFAVGRCVEDGRTEYPRFWCTEPEARACSLDRTGEVQCSTSAPPEGRALPPSLQYAPGPLLGFVAEADYCPFYHVRITNHDCTNPNSTTFPISNVNFMREKFGTKSRCLESTLYGDVSIARGLYKAEADKFSEMKPRCYEVVCAGPGAYEVWVADLAGSSARLGTCRQEGQELKGTSLQGAVKCAAPEELCGLERAAHLSVVGWQMAQPASMASLPAGGPIGAPAMAPAGPSTALYLTLTYAMALVIGLSALGLHLRCRLRRRTAAEPLLRRQTREQDSRAMSLEHETEAGALVGAPLARVGSPGVATSELE